jgi:hypothetical protein
LAAAYTAVPAAARYASRLETLMMDPPLRRAVICLPTALQPRMALRRLLASRLSMSSSARRRRRECWVSPAQLTRMSIFFCGVVVCQLLFSSSFKPVWYQG